MANITVVSKFRPNKGEGSSALTSDQVVYSGDDFMCHIAFLITLFVAHVCVPDCFLSSTITPISKGHNANVSDSRAYIFSKYRSQFSVP